MYLPGHFFHDLCHHTFTLIQLASNCKLLRIVQFSKSSLSAATAPSTVGPVDMMNIAALLLMSKATTAKETTEESVDSAEAKLMVLPSQIHKIAALVSLLCQQQDLLRRLQEMQRQSNVPLSGQFTWRSQLQYTCKEDSKMVDIQVRCQAFLRTGFGWMVQFTSASFVGVAFLLREHFCKSIVAQQTSFDFFNLDHVIICCLLISKPHSKTFCFPSAWTTGLSMGLSTWAQLSVKCSPL